MKKSNWASWTCGKQGWVASRGTSRRWRRGVSRSPRPTVLVGRVSAIARRGCRVRCSDYRDGAAIPPQRCSGVAVMTRGRGFRAKGSQEPKLTTIAGRKPRWQRFVFRNSKGLDRRPDADAHGAGHEVIARRDGGAGVLRRRRRRCISTASPTIVVAPLDEVSEAIAKVKSGDAYAFVRYPFVDDEVAILVDRTLDHVRLARENQQLRSRPAANLRPLRRRTQRPIPSRSREISPASRWRTSRSRSSFRPSSSSRAIASAPRRRWASACGRWA